MKGNLSEAEVIRKIKRYEKNYAANNYNGKGSYPYIEKSGKIPVMISAPHAVNHFRESNRKFADLMTGGISQYLHEKTGCHVISTTKQVSKDPNYDEPSEGDYKTFLRNYVEKNEIKVLIDIHGAAEEREFGVEIGTVDMEDSSLHQYKFISDLIQYYFEYHFKNLSSKETKEIWKNKVFSASNENTITNYISANTKVACIQLEINKKFRDPDQEENLTELVAGLVEIIETLGRLDWNASKIMALKVKQSKKAKPQDKVEILASCKHMFYDGDLLNIFTADTEIEQVRLHIIDDKRDLEESSCAFLTNRLIFSLFGRTWIEGGERTSSIEGKPIILYYYENKEYKIGTPLADKIDHIMLSSNLYNALKVDKEQYDFMVYNKYSDIRIHLDMEKADYGDNGRVVEEKVMMPLYYKVVMGDLKGPLLDTIREEEYNLILKKTDQNETKSMNQCYEKVDTFFHLREEGIDEKDFSAATMVQEKLRLRDSVQILKIPKRKEKKGKRTSCLKQKVMKMFVGYSEYMLRTTWTGIADDKNNIARISPSLMSLLGVSENDKIVVCFGQKQECLRVLASGNNKDYLIGIPAKIRQKLGLNSVNDIVRVRRDMHHTFMHHSVQQGVTFVGTLVAVASLTPSWGWRIVICSIGFPIMLYWVLSGERIRVK